MLLITGPSGNVGMELVERLAASSPGAWRVASRHPDVLRTKLAGSDAQVVAFDFFDRGTWPGALEGVHAVFLLFPLPSNRSARTGIIPFVEAATAAGCRHVVYVSVLGADRSRVVPHFQVEAALRQHIPSWTILRCGFFMQNLHRAISTHGVDVAERGEVFIPAGRGATTFLDAYDVAQIAALVLEDPAAHCNTIYDLTGPRRLTMWEVAETLSGVLGRSVLYTNPSLVRFATRLRRRGVGWDTIGFMCAVYTLTRFGQNQQLSDDVGTLLGRAPRDLADFVADNAWRWRQRAWT